MAPAPAPTLSSRAAVAPPVQLVEALVLAAPRLVRAMVARVAWRRKQRGQLAWVARRGTPVKVEARVTPRLREVQDKRGQLAWVACLCTLVEVAMQATPRWQAVQDKRAQEERLAAAQAALGRNLHPAPADSTVTQ
jgi:hypothetical protein